jgi:predicted PurR-regulated permease PerM
VSAEALAAERDHVVDNPSRPVVNGSGMTDQLNFGVRSCVVGYQAHSEDASHAGEKAVPMDDNSGAAITSEGGRVEPRSLPALLDVNGRGRSLPVMGIFVLLLLFALYLASPVLIPIATALLLSMLLAPLVGLLELIRVPRALGAAIIVLGLLLAFVTTIYALAGPAQRWLTEAPTHFHKVEEKLRAFRKPIAEITKATDQLEKATELKDGQGIQKVKIERPALTEIAFGGTAHAISAVGVVLVLLFLLLASGDVFLRKLVSVIPTLHDKKRAVDIVRNIETDISFYLVMITGINFGIGIAVGATTAVLGIPNPLLWGTLAALLSFAPYVGEAVIFVILAMVGMLTFDTLAQALIAPLVYFGLMSVTWRGMVPFVARRRLTLNPVAVFIMIILLGWMWGVIGALVAVPLLASFRIICERVEPLGPIAEFLSP